MKIGIITYHSVLNYGALFQSWGCVSYSGAWVTNLKS